MTTALIDGDIVTYRVGFTTEDTDHQIACWRANEMCSLIMQNTNATNRRVFLTEESDPNAFRRKVYPEYKAHRVKPRPKWYKEIRDFLCNEWDAEIVTYIEADDAMGINQKHDTIICSIDKDLKQIAGDHFDFVKGVQDYVEEIDGLRYFYTQLLTGDSSDNIKGVPKIGPKKAELLLQSGDCEEDWFNIVRDAYANDEEMLMNGRCLWIWKKEDDDWRNHYNRLCENA